MAERLLPAPLCVSGVSHSVCPSERSCANLQLINILKSEFVCTLLSYKIKMLIFTLDTDGITTATSTKNINIIILIITIISC